MDEMGLTELNYEIGDLRQASSIPERRLGQELRKRRDWLREQVRDYVEKQFLLNADVSGKRLREELLRKIKLSNVEHRNFRMIQKLFLRWPKDWQRCTADARKFLREAHSMCQGPSETIWPMTGQSSICIGNPSKSIDQRCLLFATFPVL